MDTANMANVLFPLAGAQDGALVVAIYLWMDGEKEGGRQRD